MKWIDQALTRFCQDMGVALPSPLSDLVQLEFEHAGTLQLERHAHGLTLWLALELPWHQAHQGMLRALSRCYSRAAPPLPLRCGWAGESRLLLFITLEARRVTVPVLHQALRTLIAVREEVLAP